MQTQDGDPVLVGSKLWLPVVVQYLGTDGVTVLVQTAYSDKPLAITATDTHVDAGPYTHVNKPPNFPDL